MKKLISLTILATMIVGFAGAQTTKPAPKAPTTIACAVMPSNKVNIAEATKKHMYADYKGNRYFFCCGGCPGAFKKSPATYVKSAHIATPKTAATKAAK
jgi:YHS domain-containing protein